jgi:hypothetical protein
MGPCRFAGKGPANVRSFHVICTRMFKEINEARTVLSDLGM